MPGNLDDYRRKRDFERTREPAADSPADPSHSRGQRSRPAFVVHRHEATRLHYDLRLEMEGVLRSWAVPKGFDYDPTAKHLAVRTEDHPIEYEDFDGVIPDGQYGAGAMTIWDRGTYEVVLGTGPEAVAKGELKVVLRGRRLRGEWHLVKTKGGPNHWLLFKSRDRYAGRSRDSALGIDPDRAPEGRAPENLAPMAPAGEVRPFADPDWLFELDFEGRRVLAEKNGGETRLRGLDAELPEIAAALAELSAERALLDGVLVVTGADGRPSRRALDARLEGAGDASVVLYAFDLLFWEDYDLRPLPAIDRKRALRHVLPESRVLLFTDAVAGGGDALAEVAAEAGLRGLIAKRADSPYASGPSPDWRRIPVAAAAASGSVAEALERSAGRPRRSRVRITNPGKVFWPADGTTKGDLVAYYESVCDVLLPHLRDRPVHLNRFPDGIEGKSFYQHEAKEHTPDWIPTALIASDSKARPVPHVLCNDRDTLLWLVNSGTIDLHPWMSRAGSLESPDWTVLDLDPKEAPFAHVVRIAREAGKLLHGLGMRPLVKTSGKTGLHVYVPLAPGYTYEQSRMFCEAIARALARKLADVATVERKVAARGGKVYLDFGQNRIGQTVVPPYVVRPVPGATVSTPLAWDELDGGLSIADFTIRNVPERIERLGDLFRPALTDGHDLLAAAEALIRS